MSRVLFSAVLTIILMTLFSACGSSGKQANEREKVFFDDGGGSGAAGDNNKEIAIEDTAIKNAETQAAIARVSHQQSDQTQSDGTKISTMYDGFGNKTERRFFRQHQFLEAMVLRTSNSGQKEVLVFGLNGEVKTVPPNMIDRAMTATADELAKAAGILQGRKIPAESFSFYENSLTDNVAAASTVPDYAVKPAVTETPVAQTEAVEKQEIQNQPLLSVKNAETEYRTIINNLNLKPKKNQTAQNVEKINQD